MSGAEPMVISGAILAQRLFDVAYEIDLATAEASWARNTNTASSRGRLTATPAKAMAFGVPPVQLALDPVSLDLPDGRLEATVTARLFDFGVVSITLRVPVANQRWGRFTALIRAVDTYPGLSDEGPVWSDLLARIRRGIGGALVKPRATVQQDYLVGVVQAFDEPLSAEALLQRVDLVPFLSGEQRPLSDGARRDLLQHRYSYYTDDLVVVTWNRAH
ncbi:MAG: hypothetical protein ACJ8AW_28945 [Rhodopila sp.]